VSREDCTQETEKRRGREKDIDTCKAERKEGPHMQSVGSALGELHIYVEITRNPKSSKKQC
jgi:hypothetical protein